MYSDTDIQYALEVTQILHEPDRRIDTFGSTSFEFHLVSELMDSVGQCRVRNGTIEAQRPMILRPEGMGEFEFDGFGAQAGDFADWFKRNIRDLSILKYGFQFKRTDVRESLVHDPLETVCGRIVDEVRAANTPQTAVICGVDDTWEICLLKFTIDMIQKSSGINLFDFKRRGLL